MARRLLLVLLPAARSTPLWWFDYALEPAELEASARPHRDRVGHAAASGRRVVSLAGIEVEDQGVVAFMPTPDGTNFVDELAYETPLAMTRATHSVIQYDGTVIDDIPLLTATPDLVRTGNGGGRFSAIELVTAPFAVFDARDGGGADEQLPRALQAIALFHSVFHFPEEWGVPVVKGGALTDGRRKVWKDVKADVHVGGDVSRELFWFTAALGVLNKELAEAGLAEFALTLNPKAGAERVCIAVIERMRRSDDSLAAQVNWSLPPHASPGTTTAGGTADALEKLLTQPSAWERGKLVPAELHKEGRFKYGKWAMAKQVAAAVIPQVTPLPATPAGNDVLAVLQVLIPSVLTFAQAPHVKGFARGFTKDAWPIMPKTTFQDYVFWLKQRDGFDGATVLALDGAHDGDRLQLLAEWLAAWGDDAIPYGGWANDYKGADWPAGGDTHAGSAPLMPVPQQKEAHGLVTAMVETALLHVRSGGTHPMGHGLRVLKGGRRGGPQQHTELSFGHCPAACFEGPPAAIICSLMRYGSLCGLAKTLPMARLHSGEAATPGGVWEVRPGCARACMAVQAHLDERDDGPGVLAPLRRRPQFLFQPALVEELLAEVTRLLSPAVAVAVALPSGKPSRGTKRGAQDEGDGPPDRYLRRRTLTDENRAVGSHDPAAGLRRSVTAGIGSLKRTATGLLASLGSIWRAEGDFGGDGGVDG